MRQYSQEKTVPSLGSAIAALEGGTEEATALNLLLVDDSKLNRRMLARLLDSDDSCRCDEAEDGVEAVRCVKDKLPDCYDAILMDFMMVRMCVCVWVFVCMYMWMGVCVYFPDGLRNGAL